MISFTLITSTPAVVRNFLIARGIIQQSTNPMNGQTELVGLLPGLEWIEVPNPIITTPAVGNPGDVGYIPPVMDTRHVYLVKFAHEDQDDQQAGIDQTLPTNPDGTPITPTPEQLANRTKFGQWVKNNSVRSDLDVNGVNVPAFQITGQQIWVVPPGAAEQAIFGMWQ